MKDPKIKDIICQLKAHKISPFEVPEEYENNNQILDFERKRGLRVTGRRGFDVISNSYFVEEELFRSIDYLYKRNIVQRFDSFDAYFDYLNGDIYQKACYTFCNVSDITTSKQKIDTNRLMEPKSFVEHNIDTYSLPLSSEELDQYENGKDTHVQCKQWVARFNTCASLIDFKEIASIIYKVVYPSVPALLEANCPSMFEQYTKLIGTNPSNPIAPKHDTHLSIPIQEYLETDIYKASREIKKMQKLHSNILTSWYENISTSAYPLYLP